jgi:hypothetical protein
MDLYFPNSGWLRVSRDTLDRLQQYKASRAVPTWDQAFELLLKHAGEDGLTDRTIAAPPITQISLDDVPGMFRPQAQSHANGKTVIVL